TNSYATGPRERAVDGRSWGGPVPGNFAGGGANRTAVKRAVEPMRAAIRRLAVSGGPCCAMCRILLIIAALVGLSGGARAHPFPDTSVPGVGSTLRAAPAQVQITFTEDLEAAFSTLRVEDAQGTQVDRKDTGVGPNPKLMHTSLPPQLPPGAYQVIWRVLSVDGHVTEGKYKFTIAP